MLHEGRVYKGLGYAHHESSGASCGEYGEADSRMVYPLPLPALLMWSAAASLLMTGRLASALLAVLLAGSCCGCVSASQGMRSLNVSIDLWAGAASVASWDKKIADF